MINVKKYLNKSNPAFIDTSDAHYANAQVYQTTKLTRIHQRSRVSLVGKPAALWLICAYSSNLYAAILSDNSERRIEVRYGTASNANAQTSSPYLTPAANTNKGDSLQGLIKQKQREHPYIETDFIDGRLSIEEKKRIGISAQGQYNNSYNHSVPAISMSYQMWLNNSPYRAGQVANYQRYLNAQLGAQNVPPLDQLLTTARSWERCGYEPYQLPPQELWSNIVPTLQLYSHLKNQGILPFGTEIRSVYRSPDLNDCAGGASSSKHMSAGAMDIWIPEYGDNEWRINNLQDKLCDFWQYQGAGYAFGLGIYSTGAIHLDTQGYRKWGANYSSIGSSCRY